MTHYCGMCETPIAATVFPTDDNELHTDYGWVRSLLGRTHDSASASGSDRYILRDGQVDEEFWSQMELVQSRRIRRIIT